MHRRHGPPMGRWEGYGGPTSASLGPVVTVQVQEHTWSTMCISAKVVADASEFIDFSTT